MKKLGLFICFVLSIFVLVSCVEPGEQIKHTPAITFEQETLTFKVGDIVDENILLDGVKAINSKGEELKVTVYHTLPIEDGKLTKSGQYSVKYVAEEGDLILTEYRDLVVIYIAPDTDDLVINGDLESGGTDPFGIGLFENGGGQISVVTTEDGNKVLKLEITSLAYSQGSPRVETNKFELDPTKYYAIQFTAWADEARSAHIQIGELLSAAPWYNQIGSGDWYADLTTEAKDFEFRFQPDVEGGANMANAQLLFEFGTMANGQSAVTNCYLDNIKVVEVEDLGIETILKAETMLEFGEEGIAKENPNQLVVWYDQGGWCGNPSVVATTLNEGVITIDAKQPEGSCWFAAQAFLYTAILPEANYKLTFKLTSTKAGQITICGQVMDIIEGENMITLDKNIVDEMFGLTMQLGVDGIGNMGDVVVTISDILLVNNGPIKEPIEYADPENLFGNYTEVVFGGEGDSKNAPNKFNVWYVQDPNWGCGPVVATTFAFENGVLKVNAPQTAENWWFATQIFYTTLPFETAGDHKLTFELVSNVAGEITICGKKMAIIEGKNEIEVEFTVTKGNSFTFTMQLGWLEQATEEGAEDVSHTLAGNVVLELSNFSIDNQNGGTITPVQPAVVVPPVGPSILNPETLLEFGEEADSIETPNKVTIWYDQGGWCGAPSVVTATLNEGVITMDAKQPTNSCWFAAQMFLYTEALSAGDYQLQFVLYVSRTGKVTVCGQVFDVVYGENLITIDKNLVEGEKFGLALQLGVDGQGNMGDVNAKVSYIVLKKVNGDTPVNPDKTQLEKPVGVVLNGVANGTIVAFAPVDNATGYKVYVYNGEELVYEQVVTNGGLVDFNTPGTYMVKAQALGDGENYTNSELSDPVEWKIAGATDEVTLTKPVGVVCNPLGDGGYICAFAPVTNAVSYKIYVYNANGELVHSEEIANGGRINFTTAGTYTVKVQALGNGSNIKDSELSDPVNWSL